MDLVFSRTGKIPKSSWGKECSLCSSRHGVPIECSAPDCKAAYHTTCAIRGKLKMQAIFGKNFKGGIKLRSYCKKHSPRVGEENGILNQADKIDASGVKELDMTNLADDRLQGGNEELDYFWKYVDINEVHKNISEAYARARKLRLNRAKKSDTSIESPSTSPKKNHSSNHLDFNIKKVKLEPGVKPKSPKKSQSKGALDGHDSLDYRSDDKVDINDMQEVDPLVIDLIYRYWMLLRTANNGQSLIKFSPTALKEREFEQRKNILKLRIELERVRNLSYMIGKREKLKASWLRAHQNIIKRTFSVINELNPPTDVQPALESSKPDNGMPHHTHISSHNSNSHLNHHHQHHPATISLSSGKKFLLPSPQLQPTNGMFDESDQLINDLVTCDQIYDLPNSLTINYNTSNHNNLSYQERSTMDRRRTLSLVRRINRQLKSVCVEPKLNPYAKNYLAPKRSDSPLGGQPPPPPTSANRLLKYR